MTQSTMDILGRNPSLGFVGRTVEAIRSNLVEQSRRSREYWTIAAELRQYSAGEIVELGISRADIDCIAGDAVRSRSAADGRTVGTPD